MLVVPSPIQTKASNKLKERNIKIGDFEKKLGFSVGYFSRFKTNESGFKLEEALKIAEIFNMTIEEIIDYKNLLEKMKENIGKQVDDILENYSKEEVIYYLKKRH